MLVHLAFTCDRWYPVPAFLALNVGMERLMEWVTGTKIL